MQNKFKATINDNIFNFNQEDFKYLTKDLLKKDGFKDLQAQNLIKLVYILKDKIHLKNEFNVNNLRRLTSFEIYKVLLSRYSYDKIIEILQEPTRKQMKEIFKNKQLEYINQHPELSTKCQIKFIDGTIMENINLFLNIIYGNNYKLLSDITNIIWPECCQDIEYIALDNLQSLKTFEFPTNFNNIDSFCFTDCKNLKYVKLPDNVNLIGKTIFPPLNDLKFTIPNNIKKRIHNDWYANY